MSFYYYGPEDAQKALEESPVWSQATEIDIGFGDVDILDVVLQPEQLPELGALELSGPAIGPGLGLLAQGLPPRLHSLRLEADGAFDLRGLSGILGAHQLRKLGLSQYMDDTLGPMLDATDTLQQLSLSFCLTPPLMQSLAPHLHGLQVLDFGHNPLGDEGLALFAESAPYPDLRQLHLDSTKLTTQGARYLAETDLPALHELHIGINEGLGDEGVLILAKAPWFEQLQKLRLNAVGLTDEGAKALAADGALKSLKSLDLSGSVNPLGDHGALALALSPHTKAMEQLLLTPHHMSGDACLELLLARPELDPYGYLEKKITASELKAKARELNLSGYSRMNKGQLLQLLRDET